MEDPKTKETIGIYNNIAIHFNETRQYLWNCVVNFFDENLKDGLKILDIGCGNGKYYSLMAKKRFPVLYNCSYLGIDKSEELLKICKKQNIPVIYGDMLDLSFIENDSQDIVLSIASFHHLSTIKSRNQAIKEMIRILKPGGKILMTVFAFHLNQFVDETKNQDIDALWHDIKNKKIYHRYYHTFTEDEIRELFKPYKDLHILNISTEVYNYVIEIEKI